MIVFIVPLRLGPEFSERYPLLYRQVVSLANMRGDWRVIFGDNNSRDVAWDDVLISDRFSRLHIVGEHWNPCHVTNSCMEQLAPDDIVTVLDADLLVPQDFPEEIKRHVSAGKFYFPVRYWLHRGKPASVDGDSTDPQLANGYWKHTSTHPSCGLVRDFNSLGNLPVEIGNSWGGDDTVFFARAVHKFEVVRKLCPGLFHLWHTNSWEHRDAEFHDGPKGASGLVEKRKQWAHLIDDKVRSKQWEACEYGEDYQ
jgi:hypothetical protein